MVVLKEEQVAQATSSFHFLGVLRSVFGLTVSQAEHPPPLFASGRGWSFCGALIGVAIALGRHCCAEADGGPRPQ